MIAMRITRTQSMRREKVRLDCMIGTARGLGGVSNTARLRMEGERGGSDNLLPENEHADY